MTPHVAVCFPSCNPERARRAGERWSSRGYEVYIAAETGFPEVSGAVLVIKPRYSGYWAECNELVGLAALHGCDVFVLIGDDMDPDPTKTAAEIGAEYLQRFPDGYGVMQPLDRPDRRFRGICGSPWFGRGWLERAYGGRGPTWAEYRQFFGDQELHRVAKREGVLWLRDDLYQEHHHWLWGAEPKTDYQQANDRHWKADEALFHVRRQQGFPFTPAARVA